MIDKKDEVLRRYKKLINADGVMVAIWHVKDGKVHLFRHTKAFPIDDFTVAIKLLENDLDSLKSTQS